MTPRILAFAGSTRKESFNKKLVIVLPEQITVGKAHEAFNPDASLKDSPQQANVERLGKTLASFLMRLKA